MPETYTKRGWKNAVELAGFPRPPNTAARAEGAVAEGGDIISGPYPVRVPWRGSYYPPGMLAEMKERNLVASMRNLRYHQEKQEGANRRESGEKKDDGHKGDDGKGDDKKTRDQKNDDKKTDDKKTDDKKTDDKKTNDKKTDDKKTDDKTDDTKSRDKKTGNKDKKLDTKSSADQGDTSSRPKLTASQDEKIVKLWTTGKALQEIGREVGGLSSEQVANRYRQLQADGKIEAIGKKAISVVPATPNPTPNIAPALPLRPAPVSKAPPLKDTAAPFLKSALATTSPSKAAAKPTLTFASDPPKDASNKAPAAPAPAASSSKPPVMHGANPLAPAAQTLKVPKPESEPAGTKVEAIKAAATKEGPFTKEEDEKLLAGKRAKKLFPAIAAEDLPERTPLSLATRFFRLTTAHVCDSEGNILHFKKDTLTTAPNRPAKKDETSAPIPPSKDAASPAGAKSDKTLPAADAKKPEPQASAVIASPRRLPPTSPTESLLSSATARADATFSADDLLRLGQLYRLFVARGQPADARLFERVAAAYRDLGGPAFSAVQVHEKLGEARRR